MQATIELWKRGERMKYSEEELDQLFWKCDGRCPHCGKTIVRASYRRPTEAGAWDVERETGRAACLECSQPKAATGRVLLSKRI